MWLFEDSQYINSRLFDGNYQIWSSFKNSIIAITFKYWNQLIETNLGSINDT